MSQRFRNIIRHYKQWKSLHPDTCIEYCSGQTNLEDAIMCAAESKDENGRKHPHQYRLQAQTLQDFGQNMIQHKTAIADSNNFEELIQAVRNAKVYGIGELAVYDEAVRIGAYKNVWPDKIYLHAGAKLGASALLTSAINSDVIEKKDLPSDFQDPNLSCYELEDMLCIYKVLFQYVKKNGKII